MEMEINDPGSLACVLPLPGEISVLERQPGLRCQHHGRASLGSIKRNLQCLGAWDTNYRRRAAKPSRLSLPEHDRIAVIGAPGKPQSPGDLSTLGNRRRMHRPWRIL